MRKFDVLESMKKRLFNAIDSVPDEKLKSPAAPGKWSIAQVIDHVTTAESRSIQYVHKKTQAPDAVPPAGFMCAVRTWLLVTMLSSPLKFKAPEVVADTPDNRSRAELAARWAAARGELRNLIESLPEDLMAKALFKHPVAGRMNMGQMLEFMTSHMKRHARQVERALP